ncbi:MAG: imelysin family protein [Prevotellaceae bacterium]|nr:imelysin family protein [Prevotellaceae bacterium]
MNRVIMKTGMMMAMAAFISLGLSSCSDDNNENQGTENVQSVNEQKMEAIAQQYVSNTIYKTYAAIADATDQLYTQLANVADRFKANPESVSQSDIDKICSTFLTAREEWEKSEAFLYGAATDFGIDPHIDTWPLDADGLATALKNADQVAKLEGEDGIAYAGGKLGQELLGFHGIEFILFRDGANRKIADLRAEETNEAFTKIGAHVTGLQELIYATAVAGDLRDRCFQMEVAWNADAPQRHIDRVEEVELPFTVNGGSKSYGENMLAAGKAGSTYASWQEVMVTILQAGCENIANEVANTKIGNPYSGEDVNYIESPYSHKSFVDFRDNILSIENTLYGGRKGDGRDTSKSIIQYMKDNSYSSLSSLETAVTEAIAALEKCQSTLGSFVENVNNPLVGEAQKKVQTLDDELVKAAEWFATQK